MAGNITDKAAGNKEIDFGAVAAKLCGLELTKEQQESVEAFNREHDEAAEARRAMASMTPTRKGSRLAKDNGTPN